MTRAKLAVLAVVVSVSLFAMADKKGLSANIFPLNVEIQSFQTQPAPDTPINYMGRTLLNLKNTQVIVHATIDGQSYVLTCTTAEVNCAYPLPGTWSGRWTSTTTT